MTYEPLCGEDITETASKIAAIAEIHQCEVTAEFNGTTLTAKPGDDANEIANRYTAESRRRSDEYQNSPEYKARLAAAEIAARKKTQNLSEALATAPAMAVTDEPGWRNCQANNSDPYGACACVCRYAETWARLMQSRIALGETVSQCAEAMGRLADSEGITGFMYGCAVSILAGCWKHGDELRRWHNKESQIGNEGDRANETGGVLNPAVLVFG